jgi:hypothetical protein
MIKIEKNMNVYKHFCGAFARQEIFYIPVYVFFNFFSSFFY